MRDNISDEVKNGPKNSSMAKCHTKSVKTTSCFIEGIVSCIRILHLFTEESTSLSKILEVSIDT